MNATSEQKSTETSKNEWVAAAFGGLVIAMCIAAPPMIFFGLLMAAELLSREDST